MIIKRKVEIHTLCLKGGREVNYFLTDSLLFQKRQRGRFTKLLLRHKAYISQKKKENVSLRSEEKEEHGRTKSSDEFTLVIRISYIKVLRAYTMTSCTAAIEKRRNEIQSGSFPT